MSELSQSDQDFLRSFLYRRTGNVVDELRSYLFASRLDALIAVTGHESLEQLLKSLAAGTDRELEERVVNSLLNNETSFLRDLRPFLALKKEILPALIRARARERRLVIWSAACSTGQEPYSVVMTLEEHFPELATWEVRLFASDLSEPALQRAREGRYTQYEINRGLPAAYLVKYFVEHGREWVIRPEIRRRVCFERRNLAEDFRLDFVPDLVLLRNVLIYFDLDTRRRVLRAVHRELKSDGYLLLGGTETTTNLSAAFESRMSENALVFRPLERGA